MGWHRLVGTLVEEDKLVGNANLELNAPVGYYLT